jgi:transposase
LDERIASVSTEIEVLAKQDESCQRLMSIPGVGPIISSAVVASGATRQRVPEGGKIYGTFTCVGDGTHSKACLWA